MAYWYPLRGSQYAPGQGASPSGHPAKDKKAKDMKTIDDMSSVSTKQKTKEQRRTVQLHLRATPAVRNQMLALCEFSNATQSDVVAALLEKKQIRSHINTTALSELRQHFGLLKKCLEELRQHKVMTSDLHTKFETTLDGINNISRAVIRAEGGEEI